MEGFFILSWKVFDLIGKCCVSDNVHGKQRLIFTSQIIKHPEFITASKEDKHTGRCRVWGFYLISLDIHFFSLNYFLIHCPKRKPLSWELYKNIKRITSAVCHIYNRKVFYRNTNCVRKSNKNPSVSRKHLYTKLKTKHLPSDLLSTHYENSSINLSNVHLESTGSHFQSDILVI